MPSADDSRAKRRSSAVLRAAIWLAALVAVSVAAANNLGRLNPDGIAYMRLAREWAAGDWRLAISLYWSPLLSWLMAPAIAAGLSAMMAARIVLALSAVVFIAGASRLFDAFDLKPGVQQAALAIAAVASVFWSIVNVTPDLLVAGLMLSGIAALARERPTWGTAAVAGVCWGLAYLAKAVAFPVGFGTILLLVLLRRKLLRQCVLAAVIMLTIAVPWIVVLSIRAGHPTISSTASINYAISGPPDQRRDHPTFRTIHRPERGRITSWEDPTSMPYVPWSPFDNATYAIHQVRLVGSNAVAFLRLLPRLDAACLSLIALGLALVRPRAESRARRWRYALVPALPLLAAYLPLHIDDENVRFFYALGPLLLVAVLGAVEEIAARLSAPFAQLVMVAALLSFAVPPLLRLPTAIAGLPDPSSLAAHELARRIAAVPSLAGPVAGDAQRGNGSIGLDLAFLLDQPWLGADPDAGVEPLVRSGARLLMADRHSRLAAALERDRRVARLDARLFATAAQGASNPAELFVPVKDTTAQR